MIPRVSVLMPIYNTEIDILKLSVESILKQSFYELELILLDDGSYNSNLISNLVKIDNRILYHQNITNLGIAKTLNIGLGLARGEYIARMDADDISLKNRIRKQVNFLDKKKDIHILGGNMLLIGKKYGFTSCFLSDSLIKAQMLINNPIYHPTVMFRKKIIDKYNIKYSDTEKSEDYELWTRLVQNDEIKFSNLFSFILKYRIHNNQITTQNSIKIEESSNNIRKKFMSEMRIQLSDEDFKIYSDFANGRISGINDFWNMILISRKIVCDIHKFNENLYKPTIVVFILRLFLVLLKYTVKRVGEAKC